MRIRSNQGKKFEIDLTEGSTWGDLQAHLANFFDAGDIRDISVGFPPQSIPSSTLGSTPLSALGIRHGETLLLQEAPNATSRQAIARASPASTAPSPAAMHIRVMPDDNSCLFSAIAYVFHQGDRSRAGEMRQLAASLILSDPSEYTAVVLGRSPDEYIQWLMKPNSWGGAIELSAFARHYATEIASIDVATLRMDLFGEGHGYPHRGYLLYSGIHYDALALSAEGDATECGDRTIFRSDDDAIMLQAMHVAELAKMEHRYTDLAQFTLKCDVCGQALRGEREAEAHATATGHTSFQEYS